MSKSDEVFEQAAQRAKLIGPERGIAYVFFEAGRAYQKEQSLAAVDTTHKMRGQSEDGDGYSTAGAWWNACNVWWDACDEIARRIKES